MITSDKIIEALHDKPLTEPALAKRVNSLGPTDELHVLLLKMRDAGQVRFDIHKGLWSLAKSANDVQVS